MTLWQSPLPWLSKLFNWLAEFLPEAWLFSTAVFIVWNPAFPERLQNGICVAGLMSVATALVRMKKLEHKIDEMRATQLLREGRWQEKHMRKLTHDRDQDHHE
jgi:hypothetical protein